jgi:hypothetical protein
VNHLQRLTGPSLVAAMPGVFATAVEALPTADLDAMERELALGHMQAWRLIDGAAGYLVTRTAYVGKTTLVGFWPLYLAGHCLRPARGLMREIGQELVRTATDWGCDEMRVAGKRAEQWLRVLPGFEVAWRNGDVAELRKVL